MPWFNKMLNGLNGLERYLNLTAATMLVLVVFSQVISRYAFNTPLSWTEEFSRLCFVWISVFGSSVALRKGSHISFEYLSGKLIKGKLNKIREIIIYSLIAVFLVYIFLPSMEYVQTMNSVPLAGTSWPTGIFFICFPLASIVMILNLVKKILSSLFELLKSGREGMV